MQNIINTFVSFVVNLFPFSKVEEQVAQEAVPSIPARPTNKAHSANGGLTGLMMFGTTEVSLLQYLQGWLFDVTEEDISGIEDTPYLRETIRHRGWTEELNDRVVALGIFATGYEWEPEEVRLRTEEFWYMPFADFVAGLRVKYSHQAISSMDAKGLQGFAKKWGFLLENSDVEALSHDDIALFRQAIHSRGMYLRDEALADRFIGLGYMEDQHLPLINALPKYNEQLEVNPFGQKALALKRIEKSA